MLAIVDRIEENMMVIEIDNKIYNVEKKFIKGKIAEGDVVNVVFDGDNIISARKDKNKTESRKKYIEELTRNMWN